MKDAWFTYFVFHFPTIHQKTKKCTFFSLDRKLLQFFWFNVKTPLNWNYFPPYFDFFFVILQLYLLLLFHYPTMNELISILKSFAFPKKLKEKIQIFFSIDRYGTKWINTFFVLIHSLHTYLYT